MLGVAAVNGVVDVMLNEVAVGTDVIVPLKVDGVVPNPLTVILSPMARVCAPENAIVTLVPDTDVPLDMISGLRFVVEYVYVPVPPETPDAVALNTVNVVVDDAMIWKVPEYPAGVRPTMVT